ncbi:MAG: hypothetical protein RLP09_09710 [Sandaracinaceae bacterium]
MDDIRGLRVSRIDGVLELELREGPRLLLITRGDGITRIREEIHTAGGVLVLRDDTTEGPFFEATPVEGELRPLARATAIEGHLLAEVA